MFLSGLILPLYYVTFMSIYIFVLLRRGARGSVRHGRRGGEETAGTQHDIGGVH
jgi:hypothetical protein